MRVAAALGAALGLLLVGPAPADPPTYPGREMPLRIEPLEIEGGMYTGVRLTGAWRLDAPHKAFGGLSGLIVEGTEVTAVTDKGWWITGQRAERGLAPTIRLAAMRNGEGRPFTKSGGDAEGLTRRDGRLVVSFERDHRLAAHTGGGRIGRTVRDVTMEHLENNGGLEALATLPDGRLFAIAESGGTTFPAFVVDAQGRVQPFALPRRSHHQPTGADVGPDGNLYLLQRSYSLLLGISIRLLRYRLGADGLPDLRTVETLAAWESASGIDNMEGVAAFRATPDGPVTLWLVSDDNFNAVQRTILVELEVE